MANTYFQVGSQGDEVRQIQQQLVNAGYDPKGIDGIFGANTQAAVTAYQKAKGLTVDGIVGEETLGSLGGMQPPMAIPQATPQPITQPAATQPVTPTQTTPTLNLPEQKPYESPFASQLTDIQGKIQNTAPFTYDPNADQGYQSYLNTQRTEGQRASSDTMGEMSAMTGGRLNTWAASAASQVAQEYMSKASAAMPQFRQQALSEYNTNLQNLYNFADMIFKMDNETYGRWKDNYEFSYKTAVDTYNADMDKIEVERKKIQDAWDRTSELGYVDNESSITLRVSAGTLSKQAREAKEEQENKLELEAQQHKYNLAQINAQYEKEKKVAALKEQQSNPANMGTEQQVINYNGLRSSLLGDRKYANDPYGAYMNLMQQEGVYRGYLGDKLFDKLVADVGNMMQTQKSYGKEPTSFTENPEYAVEYDDAIADPEGWLNTYRANRQAFYDAYTPEGAQILESAAREQLEKNKGGTKEAKYQEYYTLAETDPKAFKKKLENDKATIINEVGPENYEKLKLKVE
jgi:peptidoglycan hydrolase-like protein with peptidoglycan-binding domain